MTEIFQKNLISRNFSEMPDRHGGMHYFKKCYETPFHANGCLVVDEEDVSIFYVKFVFTDFFRFHVFFSLRVLLVVFVSVIHLIVTQVMEIQEVSSNHLLLFWPLQVYSIYSRCRNKDLNLHNPYSTVLQKVSKCEVKPKMNFCKFGNLGINLPLSFV